MVFVSVMLAVLKFCFAIIVNPFKKHIHSEHMGQIRIRSAAQLHSEIHIFMKEVKKWTANYEDRSAASSLKMKLKIDWPA